MEMSPHLTESAAAGSELASGRSSIAQNESVPNFGALCLHPPAKSGPKVGHGILMRVAFQDS